MKCQRLNCETAATGLELFLFLVIVVGGGGGGMHIRSGSAKFHLIRTPCSSQV
jgi:hypothetical protein